MCPMGASERVQRLALFLYGLRDKRIRSLLLPRGMDQEEITKGWDLFLAAARGPEEEDNPPPTLDPGDRPPDLKELDAWENTWFPIAKAALKANYPLIGKAIFQKLAQASGYRVMSNISIFLNRVGKLAEGGEEERAALALLEKRGLTAAVRQEGASLVERFIHPPHEQWEQPPEEPDPAIDQALKECWTWYQQWAAIARLAISRKDLRIKLGISSRAQRK